MEIITASYALPMTNGCPVVKNGAIAVELGKIYAVQTIDKLKSRFPNAEVKSFDNSVLMPGLINAHCHLDLVSFYDSVKPTDYETQTKNFEFVDTLVSTIDFKHDTKAEHVITGIQKGINRLIETGVTCVGDMTSFEGTFKLLREMGLRAVVFPEILAGRGEVAQHKFEIALALLDKYTDATHDRVRVGLGPYAPYLLSRNLLKIISQHAKEASIPLMIHAAESFAEMEFFFDSQGAIATDVFPALGWKELPPAQRKTPITYLSEIGFLEATTSIVGGLHLSANDFPALARNLSRVIWCPSMNNLMKHGTFPYAKLTEHGVPIGLGTDFWHTRQGFNMWEEMRLALTNVLLSGPKPKDVLKMATIGSARALGMDHLIGTLEEGKRSDYIIVGIASKTETAGDAIYENLIKRTEPQHIQEVVVGDHILKKI